MWCTPFLYLSERGPAAGSQNAPVSAGIGVRLLFQKRFLVNAGRNALKALKEVLIKSAAVDGERFFVKTRFEKRGNTVCISRFSNRRIGGKDPSSAVGDLFRGSLNTRINVLTFSKPSPCAPLLIYAVHAPFFSSEKRYGADWDSSCDKSPCTAGVISSLWKSGVLRLSSKQRPAPQHISDGGHMSTVPFRL